MKSDATKYVTTTNLRQERGWSDRLINELLGAPDELKPNPTHRSAAPMKLYREQRVIAAEADPRFIAYQQIRQRRSASASAVAKRRRDDLLAAIETMPVTVIRRPVATVLTESLANWRDRRVQRNDYGADGTDAPKEVRQRWAVNYIRHQLTQYDRNLEEIAGQVGVAEAASRIKRRVLAKIAEIYPEFAEATAPKP